MELVIAVAPAQMGGGKKSRKKCGCGDKNMDEKTIEFMAPEGMEMPEGLNPGDTFEAMATVQLGEEGKLNLTAIDGMSLGGMEEEAEEEGEEEGGEAEEEMVAEGNMSEGGFLDAVERRAASEKMMA
jgi:hypothetical protein